MCIRNSFHIHPYFQFDSTCNVTYAQSLLLQLFELFAQYLHLLTDTEQPNSIRPFKFHNRPTWLVHAFFNQFAAFPHPTHQAILKQRYFFYPNKSYSAVEATIKLHVIDFPRSYNWCFWERSVFLYFESYLFPKQEVSFVRPFRGQFQFIFLLPKFMLSVFAWSPFPRSISVEEKRRSNNCNYRQVLVIPKQQPQTFTPQSPSFSFLLSILLLT